MKILLEKMYFKFVGTKNSKQRRFRESVVSVLKPVTTSFQIFLHY